MRTAQGTNHVDLFENYYLYLPGYNELNPVASCWCIASQILVSLGSGNGLVPV